MVKKYLSYKDDNDDKVVAGFFEILEETENYLKFKTNSNQIIKLPWNRVLKLKGE